MGKLKGQSQHKKWVKGEKLTRKGAMLAMCYECNGLEDSGCDCLGKSCPLYPYQPYRGKINPEDRGFVGFRKVEG